MCQLLFFMRKYIVTTSMAAMSTVRLVYSIKVSNIGNAITVVINVVISRCVVIDFVAIVGAVVVVVNMVVGRVLDVAGVEGADVEVAIDVGVGVLVTGTSAVSTTALIM